MPPRFPLIAAALAALALPATAQAAAPWDGAETVSRAAGEAPSVAVGPTGQALVTWAGPARTERNAIFAARRTTSRPFGTPFAIKAQKGLLEHATVQYDRAGDALVAYRGLLGSNFRVFSATVRPSGARTSPFTLSGTGSSAYDPTFATPPAGRYADNPVLGFWRRETDRVQLSTAVGGRLLTSQNTSLTGATDARYAQQADGTVLGVGTDADRVVLGTRAPGAPGGFVLRTLASGHGPFREADVATGAGTAAAVAWREWDGTAYRLRVAVRPDGGDFGAPVTLSASDEGAVRPHVTIGPGGTVRVAYIATATGTQSGSVRGPLRVATVGGAAPQTLTAASEQARDYDVAAAADGELTVVWSRFVRNSAGGPLTARTIDSAGRVGATHRLGDASERAASPAVAVSPRGDAVVAWTSKGRVRAAHRPAS